MAKLRYFHCLLILLCALILSVVPLHAQEEALNLPFASTSLDLTDTVKRIEQSDRNLILKPVDDNSKMIVTAIAKEDEDENTKYRWVTFSLRNISPSVIDQVVSFPHQKTVDSGWLWPRLVGPQVFSLTALSGIQPEQMQVHTADAFNVRLRSGEAVTYVAQVAAEWPKMVVIWQKSEFEAKNEREIFYGGLLIGIAALAGIFMSSLFMVRREFLFPSAAVFVWASVAFIATEFGYLPFGIDPESNAPVYFRASAEVLMLTGLAAFVMTYFDLRRRLPIIGSVILALLLVCVGLMGLVYFMPEIAVGVSRFLVLGLVIGGGYLIYHFAPLGHMRAQAAVPVWSLMGLWVFIVFLATGGAVTHVLTAPIISACLALILLMLCSTVTQFAFVGGMLGVTAESDAGRKALALSGAELAVWDWDKERGRFYVGSEIENMLGLLPGSINVGGKDAWLELIHDADKQLYLESVDSALLRNNSVLKLDFRLRRSDGAYRWFSLKARPLASEDGIPTRCVGSLSDMTAQKQAEERMMRDTVVDHLTALPNKALCLDRLSRALKRARSSDKIRLFVMLVDLDRFKIVNEGLGHSAGDNVLLAMARRLQTFAGPQDTVARISGDQFAIIFLKNEKADPQKLATKIQKSLARPIKVSGKEVVVTNSVGLTIFDGSTLNETEMLKEAEIALGHSKRHGGNITETFKPFMRDMKTKRVNVESDLQKAIDKNQIEVVYQPIVKTSDQKVAGFEALMRWRHPEKGLLMPADFIHIAEDTGLIVELGKNVLEQAAIQLGTWQRAFGRETTVFMSVNFSSRQLLRGDLVDAVKKVLARSEVEEGTLKLELTETVIMENPEFAERVLRDLKQLGAGLALDDFGTGYSSLSYLQRFNFDILKVDQSFVRGSENSESGMKILSAISNLAKDLSMEVVVEGIENKEDMNMIDQLGCEYVQGYYFGEPVSAKEALSYIRQTPEYWRD